MAFLLPKLITSPPLHHHHHHNSNNHNSNSSAQLTPANHHHLNLLLLSTSQEASISTKNSSSSKKPQRSDFYLNLGAAVRTLRDDLPAVFVRDLNYDIYRDDITFVDPLNTFHGIGNYKTIFWALRFHGRILFREIGLDILRIWQPSENLIVVRWELWGVPRVPWETRGSFSGTSRYKVDRNGKIYEHKVDNLALDFPRPAVRAGSIADLVVATYPTSPNLTFWDVVRPGEGCSWTKLYHAVMETLEREGRGSVGIGIEGLVTCS